MSTRYYRNKDGNGREVGANIPDDFDIPPCSIEDVDRALFNLFDKDLPFTYKHKDGTKRAPVIFASGERFAVLRRKEPLRDKSGALILPLVSIMRTGITQSPTMGGSTNQTNSHIIKKRLSENDPAYQRLLNKQGFQNSDDLPSKNSFNNFEVSPNQTALGGRNASRRPIPSRRDTNDLNPSLGRNIYEIIEMPPPKYFTATYEITLWAQYTLQMNDMLTGLMSLYQSYSQRTFQLETDKGYWFVGYAADDLTPGNNFDEFTDNERLVRYTLTMTVPGYIINPSFPGSQKSIRRYVSAPEIQFDAVVASQDFEVNTTEGIPSGDATDYILEDIRTLDDPLPGQSISSTKFAYSDSRGIFKKRQGSKSSNVEEGETVLGGTYSDDHSTKIIEYENNPLTGEKITKKLHMKTRTNRKGETVLREALD